jgi:hypothetical protein
MRTDIKQYVQKYITCQLCKNYREKYGDLSNQDINNDPWHASILRIR